MRSRFHPCLFFLCCMSFLPSATAQIDSTALRAKFGPPLNRETFHLPAGFDLAVDYSARGRVCQMQMPALMPSNAPVTNADDMKKAMYNFLAELVPEPDARQGEDEEHGNDGRAFNNHDGLRKRHDQRGAILR